MTFEYSISKNHFNGYKYKEANSVNVLFTDLATSCISPVTEYGDKEMTNIEQGKTWMSKQHRTNETIKARGNLGIIDFEGKPEKLEKLLDKMDGKDLFYLAIPSQSNKSDKRNARYHIVYLLSEPFSINATAMKKQAKEFFNFVDYIWDEPDSGVDTRASFNAAGYFSPTLPLKDAKSRDNKKINDPYIDFDDIFKDTLKSRFTGSYTPVAPESIEANDPFNSTTVRGNKLKGEITTKIIRTTTKGYVLSADTNIMTGTVDRFTTFETLVEKLAEVEGDNPRIGALGCPICNPGHTEDKPGYAYMQYDERGEPYICCTGNACESRPYYTMAEGNISVYRVDDSAGVSKYVMFQDDQIVYTNKRNMDYKRNEQSIADELYNMGLGEVDENGRYSRGLTIATYCIGAESIEIHLNPFKAEGLNIYDRTFNISPAARFEPTPNEPNKVIAEAVKAFEDDALICGYPVSLVYLSYYMFHHKQIMAVLFLVNPDRGSGKSFWVLDLPTWYLGHAKVAGMGSAAIIAGWDDDKLGKRLVVYEDVEQLNSRELGVLRGEIKSDATAGSSKTLNIKGQGKQKSFGFNSAGTTNHFGQIPFDGTGDRRIYPAPYKKVGNVQMLAQELRAGSPNEIENRTNAINYLYKVYTDCEENGSKELHEALYYKVPDSKIKGRVEDSTSTDSHVAINIIRRSKNARAALKELSNIVASEIQRDEIKELVSQIEWHEEGIKISGSTLSDLWKMLPSGRDSMKSASYRKLLQIFGIDSELKNIRIGDKVIKGVTL